MRSRSAVCTSPGCPNITPGGRCSECTRVATQARTTGALVYDQRWQRTRRRYLKAYPYCQCPPCMGVPAVYRPRATEVHHRDGLGPHGPRGHAWDNLMSVTHAHHSRITSNEQPGGWNDRA